MTLNSVFAHLLHILNPLWKTRISNGEKTSRPHNLHSLHNNMAGHPQPAGGKSFVINSVLVSQCKDWLPVAAIMTLRNGQDHIYSDILMHGFVTEATSYSYKHFSVVLS